MLFFLVLLYMQQQPGTNDRVGAIPPKLPAPESSMVGMHVIRGIKALTAPKLDGRLDDPVWTEAPVAGDFSQNYPQSGVAATRL